MSAVEILAVAGSISLLAGWRLYLCVLATGIAMRTGWVALPDQLAALQALANPWVLGVAAIGTVMEFFADKVAWLDSLWDGVHTIVRPVGGALLALAIVDPADTSWQVIAFLLGGGGALVSHSAKAGTRAIVNTSPEPLSNIALSSAEDVTTGALIAVVLATPMLAIGVFAVLLIATIAVLALVWRVLGRITGRRSVVQRSER